MTTQRGSGSGMELPDLPGRRVEPGAADDDPNRQTPGNKLKASSKMRYGKTVTEKDVREAQKQVEIEMSRKNSTRSRTGGGQEEPGG